MAPNLATRITAPILLLAGTFFFGIMPIGVRRTLLQCGCDGTVCKPSCRARKGKVVTSMLIYFGGGVLLATCLVHLLPEAREGFESAEEKKTAKPANETSLQCNGTNPTMQAADGDHDDGHHHEHFPMPEFVVCCGFFAVYLVEEIIHYFVGGHHHVPTETRAIRSLSRSGSCHAESASEDLQKSSSSHHGHHMGHEDAPCEPPSGLGKLSASGFTVTGLMTVVALSFHSLFEGFAIGAQDSDSGLWIMFAAVSVHKFVIAFVVGLEVLAGGGKDLLVIIYMAAFAAMSPFGMVIAMITQSQVEEDAPLVTGVLNAIATGTLLYVTFCEILQREESHNNLAGWQQFLSTFAGFGLMCCVQYASTLA